MAFYPKSHKMIKLSTLVVAISLALSSQANATTITASDKAIKLAKDTILIDTHIDVPYRLHDKWADVTKATDDGDFDYPRAIQGGLNAPFMSIYIPAINLLIYLLIVWKQSHNVHPTNLQLPAQLSI
jgi:membrane dipeptidase